MLQNNIPNKLPSVEKLIQRVNAAEKSQQKEIRISIQESRELIQDLSLITVKLGKTVEEIHTMLAEIRASTTQIDVKFDGGKF
jgi:type III secretion system FlhB-like substrate exporter